MKILILYRPDSEHATQTESFVRDFQRQHDSGKKVELISVSSRDGAATATIYDVWAYPAILVIGDDGAALNVWQGMPLPLMEEVAGYIYSA